ncbi:unnamed protein product [Aspergillus oryzae RIB40]|uniref:DNA, SC026 n=1 Tax=Aspergillus oryzae (strain ATCC 42149 / RIB 40) TaxID=510516 RepID=Q2UE67_ASPOR|nr:unnamed protein product [Aspergillus oryzae RIB40]BAE60148.1 unnamed protein product [Aspergillus oryzae RIB40]
MSTPTQLQPPASPTYILRGHASPIHGLHIFHQNLRLISGDADGWIIVWDLVFKRPVAVWKAHEGAILEVKGFTFSNQTVTEVYTKESTTAPFPLRRPQRPQLRRNRHLPPPTRKTPLHNSSRPNHANRHGHGRYPLLLIHQGIIHSIRLRRRPRDGLRAARPTNHARLFRKSQ